MVNNAANSIGRMRRVTPQRTDEAVLDKQRLDKQCRPNYTTLYYTILHHTTLYYTILHYTTLYYTILHYTAL